jgi:hypothetical protein
MAAIFKSNIADGMHFSASIALMVWRLTPNPLSQLLLGHAHNRTLDTDVILHGRLLF